MNCSTENVVIRVTNLSKMYKVYQKPADMFWEVVTGRPRYQPFWSLRDISFEVKEGEILGVIGRNGAGKSTLLKILAGTLDKTAGDIEINGKISAILELGAGFHPDYTGRENITMGGICMGMSQEEIHEKIDDIIDFAELRDVIDQPFKTYSSGMQGRLTFSTAMSVDPDIFIVDEALATGDILFQEKCFRRIQEICRSGKAVLLVTHSLQYIYEVCTKCLLLHRSQLLDYGDPKKVGERYELLIGEERNWGIGIRQFHDTAGLHKGGGEQFPAKAKEGRAEKPEESFAREEPPSGNVPEEEIPKPPASAPGDAPQWPGEPCKYRAEIIAVEVLNADGRRVHRLSYGETYRIVLRITFHEDLASINVGFQLQRETGLVVTGDTTYDNGHLIGGKKGDVVTVVFAFPIRITFGNYLLRVGVTEVHSPEHFTLCHMFTDPVPLLVEARKRLNGLVDPVSEISIFHGDGHAPM